MKEILDMYDNDPESYFMDKTRKVVDSFKSYQFFYEILTCTFWWYVFLSITRVTMLIVKSRNPY